MTTTALETTVSRTAKEFWQGRSYHSAAEAAPKSELQPIFDRFLPKRSDWSVIEIGACPGNHLLALACSHGYQPVALDFLPHVRELPATFSRHGIENLEVIEQDFLSLQETRCYNVVMSLGFIEHFNNAEEVLIKHWKLVANNGLLLLSLPIFGPMQMTLRRLILTPEKLAESLQAHNTRVMDLRVLKKWCRSLPEAVILKCAHMDQMGTWFYSSDPFVRRNRRWILWSWKICSLVPKMLNISCRLFSPSGLLVLRREPKH
jgi:2-polyprenyl-3-methyl-5-hydroxy-6-metoxy-1,4-benzoquinol methylase